MVTSGWASEFIEDESQYRQKDGRNMNSVNNMTNLNTSKNGVKSNYPALAAAPPTPDYTKDFPYGQINSTPTAGNTNTMSTVGSMDATKNGKKGNHHFPSTAPATPAYPSAFQSDESDLTSSRMNAMIGLNSMKGMNNGNSSKPVEKGKYHTPTAGSVTTGYLNSFESGETDPGSARTNAMLSVKDMGSMNTVSKTKSGKKGSNPSSATASGIAGYPSTSQFNDISSSFTPNNSGNTNDLSRVKSIDTAKSGKKGNHHSPTIAPGMTGYSNALEPGEIGLSSAGSHTISVNDVNYLTSTNTAKSGKKGNQHSSTASSATPAYRSSFQSNEIGSSSNPVSAAWEEHIDEITNRKYFYNNTTGRSTWGVPNAMVKKPPPPPPISLIFEKREQDHWFRIRGTKGRKLWYNDITQVSQADRPDCLRKYK